MSEDLILQRGVEEIEDLMQAAKDADFHGKGSQYPDCSYEDDILETLGWLHAL